ncbi:MAG: hypothetical protein EZS28_003468 [Streblomastix strix]|uniref:Uncharacterized protein n=1 Tax=Streblomastix strix TaxID=222440 RepID=A0A5J4X1B8_9EUKA|nr:MAG: hypothetical protein EZS28_003468 [Streblomastix strix]
MNDTKRIIIHTIERIYCNQLFSQYPILINVFTVFASTTLYNSPLRSNEELDDSRQGAIEGMTAYQRLLKDEDIARKAGNTALQVSEGGITASLTIIELYHQIAGQVWKTIDALIKLQIEESNTADENKENLGPNTIEAICQLMLDIDEKLSDQAKADVQL